MFCNILFTSGFKTCDGYSIFVNVFLFPQQNVELTNGVVRTSSSVLTRGGQTKMETQADGMAKLTVEMTQMKVKELAVSLTNAFGVFLC